MPRAVLVSLLLSVAAVAQEAPTRQPANVAEARAMLAAMPVHDPVADGTAVRVIDGMTQQPVAGADVYVVTQPKDPAVMSRFESVARDQTELLLVAAAVLGTHYRTGEDGRVLVGCGKSDGFVVLAGERLGMGRGGQTVPIEVYAERAVDVVVRTAEGKPVRGVPVAVGRSSGHLMAGPEPIRTDRDGKAHIPVDRTLGLDVFAGVLGAFTQPCEQKVDLRKPAAAPIELVVPACGQVRFILYGPDEKPATGLGFASLRLVGERPRSGDRLRARSTTAQPAEYAPDNVMFACIEIGHDVTVTVEVAGMAKPLEFQGKGPTRVGELVIVDGRLTVGPPILSFRVVDQKGQPIGAERLGLVVRRDNQYRLSEAETDAQGRIVLPLQDTGDKDLWVLRRRAAAGTEYRGAVHRVLGAVVPGPQDLGELRLVDEPIVARGRLLDGDGKPVAGAWVRGGTTITTGSGGGSWTTGLWFHEHRVQSAADGTFEVRELDPLDMPLHLAVEGGDWVATGGLELKLGQQGVQDCRLWQPTTITARFAGGDLAGLSVRATLVHRETGQELRAQFRDGVLAPVHWAAGTYDLRIGEPQLEFAIENFRAPAGGTAGDERLRAIALPAELLVVRATVVDEAEQPVSGLMLWYSFKRPGGGSSGSGAPTDKDGRAVFLARQKDCEIAIRDGGFERQAITEIAPDLKIRVTRIAPLAVRFVGLPQLPPAIQLQVSCTQNAKTRQYGNELRGDSTTLQFSKRGTWYVRLVPMANSTMVAPALQRQIANELERVDIAFEIEATGKPAEPKVFTLTKEQQDDLAQRLQTVKALLAEEKGK